VNNAKVTKNDFKVDKSIIRHLIFSQAGTLSKALLELAMNSLDARCKDISIDFSDDMTKVVVKDNGVGFTSVEEIEKLFGTFGFDHETKEELSRGRDYGRFGLGRAQCLAFGSTVWTTNEFTMEVDLQGNSTNDLPYIITDHGKMMHKGCMIEISLYKDMSIHDKRILSSELSSMAKYVSEDLRIDGIRVNENIEGVKWNAESDDLLFLNAKSERGLAVYNKGVHVRTYSHSKFGVSGDLVSRDKNFAVNMARNDVLVAECKLWKAIPAFVKPFAEKKVRATLTDLDRKYLISQMLQGELQYHDIGTKRLFKNADGKYFSLKQVFSHADGNVTMPPSRSDEHKGMGLHRRKIAFCFSYDFADSHGFKTINEFFKALDETLVVTDYQFTVSDFKCINFDKASEMVVDSHDIIPDDELGKLDKARLNAVNSMYVLMLERFVAVERRSGRLEIEPQNEWSAHNELMKKCRRRISLGRSEVADAWTDGSRYIAIDIEVMRKAFEGGMNGLTNLLTILLHEQCHDGATSGTHDHGLEFFERFHDVITDEHINIFGVAARGLEAYMVENRRIKRPLSKREIKNNFSTFEKLIKQAV